jgi:predicted regulator of Ras-like GTPase activity (Roadblock/LC7/MglB family)
VDVSNLNTVLSELNLSISCIEGSAFVSSDGLVIASQLPKAIDQINLGSVAAAFLSLGIRTDLEVKKKGFNHIVINNNDGDVVIIRVNKEAMLLAITEIHTDLDELIQKMNVIASKIVENIQSH